MAPSFSRDSSYPLACARRRTSIRKRREAHSRREVHTEHIGVCTRGEILWGLRVYFLIERTNPRKGGFIVEVYLIEGAPSDRPRVLPPSSIFDRYFDTFQKETIKYSAKEFTRREIQTTTSCNYFDRCRFKRRTNGISKNNILERRRSSYETLESQS